MIKLIFLLIFFYTPILFSKDIKCSFVTIGHFYSYYASSELINKLENKLNQINVPNIFFLGDITHDASKLSWSYFLNFKENLKIDSLKIDLIPGNHDLLNEERLDYFKSINDGLEKNIIINNCNFILGNSVNAKENNFDPNISITGGGLSKRTLELIEMLDTKSFNILLMHHSFFNFRIWNKHHNFSDNDIIYKNAFKQYKNWLDNIEPVLKMKNVRLVYSGDGHNAFPSISKSNDINYISNSANHLKQSITLTYIYDDNSYDIELIDIN